MSDIHVKELQNVLEPIAAQISRFVILYDQVEKGLSTLSITDEVVGTIQSAIHGLAEAAETTADSTDEEFKTQMESSLKQIDLGFDDLSSASKILQENKVDRKALNLSFSSCRKIMLGTQSLLLSYDDYLIRNIIIACNDTILYIHEGKDGIQIIKDLLAFIKKLGPISSKMFSVVDERKDDLISENLAYQIELKIVECKKSLPIILSSYKIYLIEMSKEKNSLKTPKKTENYLETRKKILDLKYKSYCSLQFGSSENIFNVHPKSSITLVSPQYTINNLDIHDSQKLTKNRRIYLLANCSDNFIYILRIDTNFAVQPFQRIRHNQENLDIRGHFISNYNLLKTSKYSICFFCGTSDGFVNFYYINDNAISQFDTLILTNKEPVIDSHFPKNLDYFICGTINGNIIIAETNNL
ncbi:hypothetical protein A3Q56_01040 [Intoshia linei]|uniref:Vinculin n=1 Tax=Intoshia linei TaxID=1819745 RepID=A0A177BBY6_9BILA|nr:hypothetical protein A3Q56_01040 [Intoshia linei]